MSPPNILRLDLGRAPLALLCIVGAIVALGIACVMALITLAGTRERVRQLESGVAAYRACKTPPQKGDRTIITVRNDGLHLLITCQPLTDWRSPERITP